MQPEVEWKMQPILGVVYLTDDRGCYLANFKPKRGNYIEDEKKELIHILLL